MSRPWRRSAWPPITVREVVEVVRQSAGQAPDALHLLGLPELLLQLSALRDVADDHRQERAPPRLPPRQRELDREHAAVVAHAVKLDQALERRRDVSGRDPLPPPPRPSDGGAAARGGPAACREPPPACARRPPGAPVPRHDVPVRVRGDHRASTADSVMVRNRSSPSRSCSSRSATAAVIRLKVAATRRSRLAAASRRRPHTASPASIRRAAPTEAPEMGRPHTARDPHPADHGDTGGRAEEREQRHPRCPIGLHGVRERPVERDADVGSGSMTGAGGPSVSKPALRDRHPHRGRGTGPGRLNASTRVRWTGWGQGRGEGQVQTLAGPARTNADVRGRGLLELFRQALVDQEGHADPAHESGRTQGARRRAGRTVVDDGEGGDPRAPRWAASTSLGRPTSPRSTAAAGLRGARCPR